MGSIDQHTCFNPLAGESFGKEEFTIPISWICFKFQSPCGGVVWESGQCLFCLLRPSSVSIPLRGSRLGKAEVVISGTGRPALFQSPCGGVVWESERIAVIDGTDFTKVFQSPCGGVVWERLIDLKEGYVSLEF